MSQLLSVFGIDWKMLLVETVNFLILLGGLSYFLYKPVLKILSDRAAVIGKGVKDAEEAAIAAKEAEKKKLETISAAEREAEQIVSEAVVQGKNERAAIVKNAQDQSENLISGARAEAEELRRRALSESDKEIARLAILATERLLKEN